MGEGAVDGLVPDVLEAGGDSPGGGQLGDPSAHDPGAHHTHVVDVQGSDGAIDAGALPGGLPEVEDVDQVLGDRRGDEFAGGVGFALQALLHGCTHGVPNHVEDLEWGGVMTPGPGEDLLAGLP